MRLLLTRPEDELIKTKKKLEDKGHSVILSPVLEIRYSSILLKNNQSALAITSKNAIKALQVLPDFTKQLFRPIFCVGDATADFARKAGFKTVFSAAGRVDDLVRLIFFHNPPLITYVCGCERRGNLEGKLRAGGIQTDVVEGYRADFANCLSSDAEKALREGRVDGILFYSARSAKAYLTLTKKHQISHLTNLLTYFCLAKSVAKVFDGDNKKHIVVASHPDEESLLQLLV